MEKMNIDLSRAEYVAGAVSAAWCKHDLSVRERRCVEAAAMIRAQSEALTTAQRRIERLEGFAQWLIDAYHSDEGMPEAKDIAREARAALQEAE